MLESVKLPNGWSISPVGNQIRVGDLPMKMIVHPSQKWVLVQNAGQSDHSIQVIDVQTEVVVDSMSMNKTFFGMCFNQSGNILYATGANNNWVEIFTFSMGKLTRKDTPLAQTDHATDSKAMKIHLFAQSAQEKCHTEQWPIPSTAYYQGL